MAVPLLAGMLAAALAWPLRLVPATGALESLGLGAADLTGPAWDARARGAHWRGQALGDARLSLSPWPLLRGRQAWRVTTDTSSATLLLGHVQGVEDLDGTWQATLAPPGLAAVPLALAFSGVTARFRDGTCDLGRGHLAVEATIPGLPGPVPLAGPVACRGGELVVALANAAPVPGVGSATADLRVQGDGTWRLATSLRDLSPAMQAALPLAGFEVEAGHARRLDAWPLD